MIFGFFDMLAKRRTIRPRAAEALIAAPAASAVRAFEDGILPDTESECNSRERYTDASVKSE